MEIKLNDYIEEKEENILSKYYYKWKKYRRIRYKQFLFLQSYLHGPVAIAFYKLRDYYRHYKAIESRPKLHIFKY